ncbi:hypothetical protein CKA32_002591 [Geitlerinema sp. FC II]|nr:hypothetical protein CKA32_002591 [Geitlerinema sp. FC II]
MGRFSVFLMTPYIYKLPRESDRSSGGLASKHSVAIVRIWPKNLGSDRKALRVRSRG